MSRVKTKTPRYTAAHGWRGGDSRTLYTVVDQRTGQVSVRPGDSFRGMGAAVRIHQATRDEAELYWQKPLHSGWKVRDVAHRPRRFKRKRR